MKPYADPPPRAFDAWLSALGLRYESTENPPQGILTYEEFCSPGRDLYRPDVRLILEGHGPLYGFWRLHLDGSVSGEPRTVREWLSDLRLTLVDPTHEDLADLDLFLGHDAWWQWSAGKTTTTQS